MLGSQSLPVRKLTLLDSPEEELLGLPSLKRQQAGEARHISSRLEKPYHLRPTSDRNF